MSNSDDTMMYHQHDDGESSRHFWDSREDVRVPDQSAAPFASLINLGFIRAALRRRARLWCALAAVGLVAGLGFFVMFPASYQASASVILPPPAYSGAITDDQIYAQSRTVAALALSEMGSRQSVDELVSHYTVTTLTGRVLLITAKATSSDEAVREANAVAKAFLTFQSDLLKTQEQLVNATLQQQVVQAQQRIDSMNSKISQLSAQASSPAQETKLNRLRIQRDQAVSTFDTFKQDVNDNRVATQIATDAALYSSRVLDNGTPVAQHAKKRLLLYAGGGLLAGLVLGIGFVILQALLSDRLRRRDEVASALGAPIKLSVGITRLSDRRIRRRGLAAVERPEAQRIVAYLGKAVASSFSGPASLAVVPVDDVHIPAACLAALAVARSQEGLGVVLVDLCADAPAARLLRATGSGVQQVSMRGTELTVVVPEDQDAMAVGPFGSGSDRVAEPVAAACSSAQLLLTLVTLDPALGGEHLTTWTRSAVAVVTAGRSSGTRIQAVGEMMRLVGTPMISGVLIGADKSDESLGTNLTPEAGRDFIPTEGFTF